VAALPRSFVLVKGDDEADSEKGKGGKDGRAFTKHLNAMASARRGDDKGGKDGRKYANDLLRSLARGDDKGGKDGRRPALDLLTSLARGDDKGGKDGRSYRDDLNSMVLAIGPDRESNFNTLYL